MPDRSPSVPPDPTELWAPVLQAGTTTGVRLVGFPYAGAGPIVFRPWRASLPDFVELRSVLLPGRQTRLRETPIESMPRLIDALEPAITPLCDRPLVLFGHSLGAIVAYEVACRLRERGHTLYHLFVSANVAPQYPDPNPPIHRLPPDAFLQELRRLNGMPAAVLACAELLEIVLPVVRADFTLVETYRYEPRPPLACPITVFGGTRDPRTTAEGLSAWRAQTTGAFEHVTVPGDHFFFDSARAEILAKVSRVLAASVPT